MSLCQRIELWDLFWCIMKRRGFFQWTKDRMPNIAIVLLRLITALFSTVVQSQHR